MDEPKDRILVRVKVDDTHAELLAHLIPYQGRCRAKRIVFLAALGLLAERGSLMVNQNPVAEAPPANADVDERSTTHEIKPLTTQPDDIAFLATLRRSLP